jgi:hypothetical protein
MDTSVSLREMSMVLLIFGMLIYGEVLNSQLLWLAPHSSKNQNKFT